MLVQLVQQRDELTARINSLLQAIVGASSSGVPTAAPVKTSVAAKAKRASSGAAPKKRGRPVGWRKAAGGVVPELAKAAGSTPAKAPASVSKTSTKSAVPAAGAAPKKRGRPVGWRKAAGGVVPELAAAAASNVKAPKKVVKKVAKAKKK
ncbi:MAG: hypothetical protein ACKO9V_07475 [Candidatus Kapaibacterium sp.]